MKSILNTITAMLAAVLFVPAASAQTTSNPRMQVRVSLEKLSLYIAPVPQRPDAGRSPAAAETEEMGGF